MIKNKKFVKRAKNIVTLILVGATVLTSFVGIPQFMTNEIYVDKIKFEPKIEEKLPQNENYEPVEKF